MRITFCDMGERFPPMYTDGEIEEKQADVSNFTIVGGGMSVNYRIRMQAHSQRAGNTKHQLVYAGKNIILFHHIDVVRKTLYHRTTTCHLPWQHDFHDIPKNVK